MIYAYMRVSTPQQTLENQHYALLKFADQRAWRIDRWVTETGSGVKPATERLLGQLLEQLTAQDTLLVTELSRLGRRLMEIMQLLARLLEKHVTVICIKEGLEVGDTLQTWPKHPCHQWGLKTTGCARVADEVFGSS
jgi:putative DNA-invertase from lambdoid prophage Rac